MTEQPSLNAVLTRVGPGQADIKLVVNGRMRLLRWRRRMLGDEVLLDGRRVAEARGLWGRETVFGLVLDDEQREAEAASERLLLTVDPSTDWSDPASWMFSGGQWPAKPRIVRLETAEQVLIDHGAREGRAHDGEEAPWRRLMREWGLI